MTSTFIERPKRVSEDFIPPFVLDRTTATPIAGRRALEAVKYLGAERACAYTELVHHYGSVAIGQICGHLQRITPPFAHDRYRPKEVVEYTRRRLQPCGAAVIRESTSRERSIVELGERGEEFNPIAGHLGYWASLQSQYFFKDLFGTPLAKGNSDEITHARLSVIRGLATMEGPSIRTANLIDTELPDGPQRTLIDHLVNEGVVVPIPGYRIPADKFPLYEASGEARLRDGGDTEYAKALLKFVRANVNSFGYFNPYDLLHSRALTQYSDGERFTSIMVEISRLSSIGLLEQKTPSALKKHRLAVPGRSQAILRQLIDIIDGSEEPAQDFTDTGNKMSSALVAETIESENPRFTRMRLLLAKSRKANRRDRLKRVVRR